MSKTNLADNIAEQKSGIGIIDNSSNDYSSLLVSNLKTKGSAEQHEGNQCEKMDQVTAVEVLSHSNITELNEEISNSENDYLLGENPNFKSKSDRPGLFAIPTRENRFDIKDKCDFDEDYGKDVVDAVPTRDDRKLSRQTSKAGSSETTSLVETTPCESSQPESLHRVESDLCCQTFLALFEWKHIFTKFSVIDLFFALASTSLYIFDIITDILNACSYFLYRNENKDNLIYFGLTTLLIIVPSIITQFFSLWWEREDESQIRRDRNEVGRHKHRGCLYYFSIFVAHILQFATIFRYARAVYFGILSRLEEKKGHEDRQRFYDKKWKYEYCDVSLLRLFDSFLESAPQLVLQIYIMLATMQRPWITVVSCLASWGGLSTAFLSFTRSLRNSQENKIQLSVLASIFLVLYRLCTILSRVAALALLLNIHIWAWIGLFILHWLIMTIWIFAQKTNFCKSKGKELVFDAVIGFCYNFAYVHVHSKHNKRRMIIYYAVMFLENCAIAILWLKFRRGGENLIEAFIGESESLINSTASTLPLEGIPAYVAVEIVIFVPTVFLLGIVFMLIFYTCLHPAVGLTACKETEKSSDEVKNERTEETQDNPQVSCYSGIERSVHHDNKFSQSKDEDSWQGGKIQIPTTNLENSIQSSQGTHDIALEKNSAYCSCYSLRHEAEVHQQVVPEHNRGTDHLFERPSNMDESDKMKMLMQKKQEIQKVMLKLNVKPGLKSPVKPVKSPTEELFDRKGRAKLLYNDDLAPSKAQIYSSSVLGQNQASFKTPPPLCFTKDATTKRSLPPSPLTHGAPIRSAYPSVSSRSGSMRRRVSSEEEPSTSTMHQMVDKSGTFPRCTRRSDHGTPSSVGSNTLRPISENKLSLHTSSVRDYSASLSNLAFQKKFTKSKVPRAMSFTVSKNEEVISIESTL